MLSLAETTSLPAPGGPSLPLPQEDENTWEQIQDTFTQVSTSCAPLRADGRCLPAASLSHPACALSSKPLQLELRKHWSAVSLGLAAADFG